MAIGNLVTWYGPDYGSGYTATKIYRSTTETGTFTLVTTLSPISQTYYFDTGGSATDWYKVSFYNATGTLEGSLSSAFQVSYISSRLASTHYTTPTELRKFLGFLPSDVPSDEDMRLFLDQAHLQLGMDSGGTTAIVDTNALKFLEMLLGSTFIFRSLAARALSKGYVSVTLEGVSVQKAFDGLMRMSEYYYDKYAEFLSKFCVDYTATSYLSNTVDIFTVQDIKDTMNGISDGLDYENTWLPSVNRRTGSR